MKWFNNLKIRNKLLIVFGILVLSMIAFSVLGVVEITGIENNKNRIINFSVIAGIVFIFISVFAFFVTFNSINRPIAVLEKMLTDITDGNLSLPVQRVQIERKDELGTLSRNIGNLADKISEYKKATVDMKTMLTQEKQKGVLLQEALDAAKGELAAKSSFLTAMGHEIRTPMSAILGIAEIQLQNEKLMPNIREAMEKIYISGDLLLNIINDILDLSNIEAGKLNLAPSKYEISTLLNDTVTGNTMRTGGKPVDFQLSVDENIPAALYGDCVRIKQILNNLLSNSFKYTEEGVIKLAVAVEETAVEDIAAQRAGAKAGEVTMVFTVSDTGNGMTKEQVSWLFANRRSGDLRSDTGDRTVKGGTALGISIIRNLIRLMNGKISVESEVNKGTVFTVRLPQGRPAPGVIGEKLARDLEQIKLGGNKNMEKSQTAFEPMPYGKVLIVDDAESNLYVAKGLMKPYGLAIETVTSGFDAIEKIKNGNVYDIVFMDHLMPKMDGIETTKNMRDLGYTQPVVALTANVGVGQSELFLASGFDGFIAKPINVGQLDSTLKKFVRDKQPPEVIEAALLSSGKTL